MFKNTFNRVSSQTQNVLQLRVVLLFCAVNPFYSSLVTTCRSDKTGIKGSDKAWNTHYQRPFCQQSYRKSRSIHHLLTACEQ